MKNFVKKYVGDKAFYKTVLAIALPIMLQNGITNFVSLLDNIMVGQVGTEQMSGVAIVNQLIFVFNLLVFGTVAAGGIFTSQYHGKGNVDGVRQTFRFKLIAGTVILAVAVLIFALFNKQLIGLYLNDGSQEGDLELTLSYGVDYIWIMLIGLVPYTFSQAFAGTLRETEETLLPMIAGLAAVVVNCVGNYILIFGKFGAPELGVDANKIHYGKMQIFGTFLGEFADFKESCHLLGSGEIDVSPLVDKEYPFDQIQQAFENAIIPGGYRTTVVMQ